MVKSGKRGREEAEIYESDDGFVENDDGGAPKSKKSKKAQSGSKGDSKIWEASHGLKHFNEYL